MTPPSPELRAANRRGVLAVSAGAACFVINDTMVKYVSETLPASQLIVVRGVMASLFVLAIAHAMGATQRMRSILDRRVVLRAALDAVGTLIYLLSLFHMPLADASAINMATPLVATVLAVLFFGEKVATSRWLLIAIGFAGVLLVVQPTGAGFTPYALLCLTGTVLQATRDFATRAIPPATPSLLITLSTAIGVTLLAGVWGLFQDWQPMTARQLALLAASSVFLSGAYYSYTVAMRGGEMSVIAPFRYSGLLFALSLGWLVWGHVPNALALAGIVLVVAAGLAMLRSSR